MNLRIFMIYMAVFFIALVCFLFFLFPGQKMGAFVTGKLQAPGSALYQSPFAVSVQDIRPSFPLGLVSDHVRLVSNASPITMDFRVCVHLPLLSLFQRPLPVQVKALPVRDGVFQEGLVQVNLEAVRLHPQYWNVKHLTVQDMVFSDMVFHGAEGDLVVQGTIGGEFTQSENLPVPMDSGFWNSLSGKGKIHGKDIAVDVSRSWLSLVDLPALSFSRLDGEFDIRNRQVMVRNFMLKGPVLYLKFSGNLQPAIPWEESRISLEGRVLPESPYLAKLAAQPLIRSRVPDIARKGISFHVTGTLNHLQTTAVGRLGMESSRSVHNKE